MFFLLLSVFLFITALLTFRRAYFSVWRIIIFTLLSIFSFSLSLIFLVSDYFTGEGVNGAVIYLMQTGLDGAGLSDFSSLIISAGLLFVAVLFFLGLTFYKTYHNLFGKKSYSLVAFIFLFFSVLVNPTVHDVYKYYNVSFVDEAVLAAEEIEWDNLNGSVAPGFNLNETKKETEQIFVTSTNFYYHYQKPVLEKVGQNKNIVFIYTESLENTYSNENIFPGLTPNLNSLRQKGVYFTNLNQTYGANYTNAGIVSSQCGLPLVAPSHGNTLSGMDTYLPLATCLGDLLHQENYYLSYYGGADLKFAGKGSFYKTHGFDEVNGLNELLPQLVDKKYNDGWGLYDDTILNLTYNRFLELSQTKEKFGLFALTLDTHHPAGRVARECNGMKYGDGKNTILNAVACSDYLVGQFVKRILESPYGSNTVVVVASDHLALKNTASDFLEKMERKNRLMILSNDIKEPQVVSKFSNTLDIGPTILPFIGYKSNMGLGRDILNVNFNEDEATVIRDNIYNWRNVLSKFWYFPKIRSFVQIDTSSTLAYIDNRKFDIPILIQIDQDLQTELKFEFNVSKELNFVSQVNSLGDSDHFILVDNCANVLSLNALAPKVGFCLIKGTKNKNELTILNNESNYTLTVEQIKNLINNPV